jgi:hypothetical protein
MRHQFVVMLREGAGREVSPTAAAIDTQSVIELAWVILKHAEPTADALSAWESANLSTAPKPAQ